MNAKTPGQRAYEADVANAPRYHDGALRPGWSALDPLSRQTWERNPTPRRPLAHVQDRPPTPRTPEDGLPVSHPETGAPPISTRKPAL